MPVSRHDPLIDAGRGIALEMPAERALPAGGGEEGAHAAAPRHARRPAFLRREDRSPAAPLDQELDVEAVPGKPPLGPFRPFDQRSPFGDRVVETDLVELARI